MLWDEFQIENLKFQVRSKTRGKCTAKGKRCGAFWDPVLPHWARFVSRLRRFERATKLRRRGGLFGAAE
jgi:hypothetical protein